MSDDVILVHSVELIEVDTQGPQGPAGIGAGGTINSTDIADSTATGRAVMTAANAAAARTAIGAGTSSLALGTSGSTALAGDAMASHVGAADPHTQYGRIFVWNGSAYAVSTTADIYIGPNDPGAIDGVWIDSTP